MKRRRTLETEEEKFARTEQDRLYVNRAQGQLKHMTKFQPGEEVIDCVKNQSQKQLSRRCTGMKVTDNIKKPQEPLQQLSRRCKGLNVTDCIKLYWILLILELFHAAEGFAL